MIRAPCLRRVLAPSLALAAAAAAAQTTPPVAPAAAASAPTPTPATTQRIEITGGRESDTAQRRNATAAKIVIGREEIDKFGDATVGEVLRRLPGVTTPGAPGRGGPPRMRGLGGGFTQLLIDGQPVPRGFSLESLTPEQVERIEILRAPTAETGARAIAGTINIITREGFRRRLNDLRLGFGVENGQLSRAVNWTHSDSAGALTYNVSGSLFDPHRESSNTTRTTVADAATGTLLEDRTATSTSRDKRLGANLTSRLQWRLGGEGAGSGDMLALTPSIFHTEARSDSPFRLDQTLRRPTTPGLYDFGNGRNESAFTNARLAGQWRQRLGGVRAELNGGGGAWRSRSDSLRTEFSNASAQPLRTLEDHSRSRQDSLDLKLKLTGLAGGGEQGGEHSLVAGAEIDAQRRSETSSSLQNGTTLLADFGENLKASSVRLAAYAQDEWQLNPNWSAQAGLRWEGITTRGDAAQAGEPRPSNRSSVWTPLMHAVWKPDPKGRDQVRLSLTRSYRSPDLGNLIARPSFSRDYNPRLGSNIKAAPDSAGNARLAPELATGIDIAIERYLDAGGVLSANVFRRNITDLMRGVPQLETVSWSPFPRYVRRMQNIGDATTSGLELEAKFRLDQLVSGASAVELRGNLSLYRSRVKSVPGPDNRLDQQAKASANLGADYRMRGRPLTLGGNINWVPGTTTRIDADQTSTTSTKAVWDAYALWAFTPNVGLRLLGNNLVARDYATTTVNDSVVAGAGGNLIERSTLRSGGPSFVNMQLRLELKL
ncbi:MAG: TonB-dependent receptor [Leptothrix sp. (in: Bacteria)]|nr:TonB-dependent receptor [Leptothrix sp. (in: b-proteobacteria)]